MREGISRSQRAGDVVVVGGGVVGLSVAWRLALAGASAKVVDPEDEPRRSTWAAGGMLAPLGEAPEPGAFLDLALQSLALYPDFVAELEASSGVDVGLHLNGKLLAAVTPTDVERLEARRSWQVAAGYDVDWLDRRDVRRLEPAISGDVRAGLVLHGNGRVDNRALQHALEKAVEVAGVRRIPGSVAAVRNRRGRVEGVKLEDGSSLTAAHVVLSAGAWSGRIRGLPRSLPVRPVKGQMLAIAAPGRPLERVVAAPGAYLIPRETDGGPVIVVGATQEEAGFDRSVDLAGQRALEEAARAMLPVLAEAEVTERWAGLRPGTPDGLPILGPDPDLEGLVYASGHFRNGILLAPATARLVADWLVGAAPPRASAFAPGRFPD